VGKSLRLDNGGGNSESFITAANEAEPVYRRKKGKLAYKGFKSTE